MIDPYTATLAAKTGAGLIQSLFGSDPGEEERKQGLEMMKMVASRNYLNPYTAVQAQRTARIPQLNALGRNLDQTFGWDTGKARGALATEMLSGDAQTFGTAYAENARMKREQEMALAQALLNWRG